jgi:hypothetical protein
MKSILLFPFFIILTVSVFGQKSSHGLPSGKYETVVKSSKDKWKQGDIILINDSKYKISSSNEIGEYRVSATAQRIFFISGPLQTVFAKTIMNAEKPAIILPAAENEQGLQLSSDVVAYLKN